MTAQVARARCAGRRRIRRQRGHQFQAYWEKLAADFSEQNPGIKVEVTLLPWADIDSEVTRMVKAGKAPDVALMGSYSDFAARGELYPADELLSITAEANFLQPLADAGSVGSTLYGLPFVASSRLMFYNKGLLDKAGVKTPPKTWSELKAASKALKDKGVKYPFALPLGPEEAHAEAMIWELSNGGGYADSSGNYNLASEQNIETWRWVKENMVDTGFTGPTAPSRTNRADAFAAFLQATSACSTATRRSPTRPAPRGSRSGPSPCPSRTTSAPGRPRPPSAWPTG